MKNKLTGLQVKQLTIVLVILALAVITAMLIGGPLVFWSLFVWLTNKVSDAGVNIWLARTLVVPMALLLFYAIKFMCSLKRKKREIGLILLCVFLCLEGLGMYGLTRDQYFNKWYSKAPDGYRLYSHSGFDQVAGQKLQKVTPEIAREIEIWGKNRVKVLRPIQEEYQFFDYWGMPIRWYYKCANGKIEIFDQPGSHPTYQEPLRPVTKEIVKEYLEQLEKEKAERAIPQKTSTPEQPPINNQPSNQTDSVEKPITPDEDEKVTETPIKTDDSIAVPPEQKTEAVNFKDQKQIPEDFEGTLANYGKWMGDPYYHKIWVPKANKEQKDWKPYQNGMWQDYDGENYLWVSSEPFGDITFHYGRWQWNPLFKWYWIPGDVWGPAWVNVYWLGDDMYWSPMWHDDRYHNQYSRDYNWTGSRFWMSVHKNQLQNHNLSRIIKRDQSPPIRINPNNIKSNVRQTNINKTSVSPSPRSTVPFLRLYPSPSRSLQNPRPVSPLAKKTINKKQLLSPRIMRNRQSPPANLQKKQVTPTVKQKQTPPATNKKQPPPPVKKKR